MKREIIKERRRNKTQEAQVIHNTIAHRSLTDTQPIPKQQSEPPSQLPSVYTLTMTFCSMECPFGQFGSAVLIVLPPSF